MHAGVTLNKNWSGLIHTAATKTLTTELAKLYFPSHTSLLYISTGHSKRISFGYTWTSASNTQAWKKLLEFHIPWQELNRDSRGKLNKKGQYGGLNNFAGGATEMNPVLPAPLWEVVGSCITINSPHTSSSHFLHDMSVEPHFHILPSLSQNNTHMPICTKNVSSCHYCPPYRLWRNPFLTQFQCR